MARTDELPDQLRVLVAGIRSPPRCSRPPRPAVPAGSPAPRSTGSGPRQAQRGRAPRVVPPGTNPGGRRLPPRPGASSSTPARNAGTKAPRRSIRSGPSCSTGSNLDPGVSRHTSPTAPARPGRDPRETAPAPAPPPGPVGCRNTATREIDGVRQAASRVASSGVTRRGESANTNPTACAPARSAARAASSVRIPQIFTCIRSGPRRTCRGGPGPADVGGIDSRPTSGTSCPPRSSTPRRSTGSPLA